MNVENSEYWKAIAEAEYKTGNIVSSLDAYDEASQLDPTNVNIWIEWSYIYFEQGDKEQALEIITNGIEESVESATLYYRAVIYLIELGLYKKAFTYLEQALVLNYEEHVVLYDFFPNLETQKALFKIIEQYK